MLVRVALVCLSLLAPACGSKPGPTSQPTTSGTAATDKILTNEDFRTQFQRDAAGNKAKADANWPGLVAQHGK